jgi:hypothetical protein
MLFRSIISIHRPKYPDTGLVYRLYSVVLRLDTVLLRIGAVDLS